jgi:hypothetical protein
VQIMTSSTLNVKYSQEIRKGEKRPNTQRANLDSKIYAVCTAAQVLKIPQFSNNDMCILGAPCPRAAWTAREPQTRAL